MTIELSYKTSRKNTQCWTKIFQRSKHSSNLFTKTIKLKSSYTTSKWVKKGALGKYLEAMIIYNNQRAVNNCCKVRSYRLILTSYNTAKWHIRNLRKQARAIFLSTASLSSNNLATLLPKQCWNSNICKPSHFLRPRNSSTVTILELNRQWRAA